MNKEPLALAHFLVTTQHRSVLIIIAWGNAPGGLAPKCANYYSLGQRPR